MKLNELHEALKKNLFMQVEIMRNPADLEAWVVWVRDELGKSDLLTNGSDYVVTDRDVNELISLLRTMGAKRATIVL